MSDSETNTSESQGYVTMEVFQKYVKKINSKIRDLQSKVSNQIDANSKNASEAETTNKHQEEFDGIPKGRTKSSHRKSRGSRQSLGYGDIESIFNEIQQLKEQMEQIKEDMKGAKESDSQTKVKRVKRRKHKSETSESVKENEDTDLGLKSINEMKAKQGQFEEEIQKLKTDLEKQSKKIKKNEIDQLKQQMETIETDVKSLQKVTAEQGKGLKTTSQKLNSVISSTSSGKPVDLTMATAQIDQIEDINEIVQTHEQMLTQQAHMISQQNDQLTVQKDLFNKKFSSYLERIKIMEKMFDSANESITVLRNESKRMQKKLNDNSNYEEALERMKKLIEGKDNSKEILEKVNDLEGKINKLEGNLNKFDGTYVDTNTFDGLKQKVSNLKKNLNKQIIDLNDIITKELSERKDSIEQIQKSITETNDKVESSIKKQDKEISFLKEQIIKLAQSGVSTQSEDGSKQVPQEFNMDLDEIRQRVNDLEKSNTENEQKLKESFDKQETMEKNLKEQFEDYKNRIANMEYVTSEKHEEYMDKLRTIEENNEDIKNDMNQFPVMISKSIDDRNIAIEKLSKSVNDSILDMQTQLKQVGSFDDEIDELHQKIKNQQKENKEENQKILDKINSIENKTTKQKDYDQTIQQIRDELNSVRVELDVQLNTTNPLLSKMIKKNKRQIKKLKNIQNEDSQNEDKEEDDESVQTLASIETIKQKIALIEKTVVSHTEDISNAFDDISSLKEDNQSMINDIRNEVKSIYNVIPDKIDESDLIVEMKEEIKVLSKTLSTFLENNLAEREKTAEQIKDLKKQINASIEQNPDFSEQFGNNVVEGPSSSEIQDLKIMIDGIDLSTRKQIRKIKRSVRVIEQALEAAQEEEKKKDEENQKKHRHKKHRRSLSEDEEVTSLTDKDVSLENTENKEDELTVSNKEENDENKEEQEQLQKQIVVSTPVAAVSNLPPYLVEVMNDNFNIFFVIMFAVLLYFLISDLFI